MAYFAHFPKIQFLNQTIVNLAVGFQLNNLITDETYSYLNYDVKEGEKPDHVAYNYYGDSSYEWLVLQANEILDPYFQWVLTVKEFEDFLKKKYGSLPIAQATTIHCEHKTKNITLSADSLAVSNGASASDYSAIDAYTYWDQVNENRRHIRLVNKIYLSEIDSQISSLLNPARD